MATVYRSSRAEIDLTEIWGFIAKDDPLAADRQLDRLNAACEMLAGNRMAAHAAKTSHRDCVSIRSGTT